MKMKKIESCFLASIPAMKSKVCMHNGIVHNPVFLAKQINTICSSHFAAAAWSSLQQFLTVWFQLQVGKQSTVSNFSLVFSLELYFVWTEIASQVLQVCCASLSFLTPFNSCSIDQKCQFSINRAEVRNQRSMTHLSSRLVNW